jgi:energy-coupling factor transporter transmembrane protein EcfT
MTEAAYARGFDSPRRKPYHRLAMGRLDWVLLAAATLIMILLLRWR